MNLVDCTNKREHPTKSSLSYSPQVDCILLLLLVVAGVVGFIDFVPVLLNTLRIKRTNGSGFSKKLKELAVFMKEGKNQQRIGNLR
jgi:hypothetical protein